jgi:hypothetical protein
LLALFAKPWWYRANCWPRCREKPLFRSAPWQLLLAAQCFQHIPNRLDHSAGLEQVNLMSGVSYHRVMVDADGNLFKPGPFIRAYLTLPLIEERWYLFVDAQAIATRSFLTKTLYMDSEQRLDEEGATSASTGRG